MVVTCQCGYSTSSKYMSRHRRTCKALPFAMKCEELTLQMEDLQRKFDAICDQRAAHVLEIDALHAENQNLTNRLDELRRNMPTSTKSVTINNTIMNVTPFECTPLPDRANVKRMLASVRTATHAAESIPKYLKMKHFTSDETRNLKLTNVRGTTVQIVECDSQGNKTWRHKDRKQVTESLTERNIEELVDEFGAENFAAWRAWYSGSGLDTDSWDKSSGFRDVVKRVDHFLMSEH